MFRTKLFFFALRKLLNCLYLILSHTDFLSLVSSCYNHFALSCDMRPTQRASLKHAVTSILVPKRVCGEALYSLVTPGHLLSPHLFLHYRHIIKYLLYVQTATPSQRTHVADLWYNSICLRSGPCHRLRSSAKSFGFSFEGPFMTQLILLMSHFIISNT